MKTQKQVQHLYKQKTATVKMKMNDADAASSLNEFLWPIIHETGWRSNSGYWSKWDVKRFYDYAGADRQLEVLKADKAQGQDELCILVF